MPLSARTPARRRLRSALAGGAVPLMLLAAVPAQSQAAETTYTVRPGDGWWVISERTGVSMSTLWSLNGMSASTMLHPGMVLKTGAAASAPAPAPTPTPAPAPTTGSTVRYTVVTGDTLWGISQRFEVSISQLLSLNRITAESILRPGQVLVISNGAVAPQPVSDVQPIGNTFLHYTYPPHVTAAANENYRLLQSVPVPSREQMQQIVRETAAKMGVDPRLALAHAYTESRFNQRAVSPANAIGTMQVIPVTGEFASQLVGRKLNLLDPYDNVTAGIAYIKYIQARTPTLELGIGAYYQGLGGVLRDGPRPDTVDYIAKVKAAMAMF
ncbi:LysM peptidoglycan-binding domain-containing protein [uncultured Micrococcus sp.]|uniref:LysM peptidoglycan-binding domain-containing protein n=1 Tax=uncultured Micrococcus sp. TaxID=114051 RepID=UPI002632EA9F|nr:LysM peptidoglycan-binding domain-containing protein [uncultured Micrococcus sp.]